ncbi:hypothetical protein GDO86_006941 [Hymenochirus boettgeri]|uniref:MRH domain-containing protein n=1 Tax=Hymenochirus boettgeri TaxID=247094 RepID=A0A8T2JFM9_9PIPI|nr:hypothetical protein GDO86_006941 [Hymenochirus boettgeri]
MLEKQQTVQTQVDALRLAKEEAEKPEKEAKDAHTQAWEERKEAERAEIDKLRSQEVFTELDQDSDGMVAVSELISHPELDVNGDGTLSEEEAQSLFGGSPSLDIAAFQETLWPQIREKYKSEPDTQSIPPVEEGTDSHPEIPQEEEEDEDREDGEDDDDEEEEQEQEDFHKGSPPKTQEVESEMPQYDEHTESLIEAAQKARTQHEEAEKSLREIEDTIRSLEKEISLDLGPNGEFSYLYGECHELSTSEYIYRLCPFNRVTQKPKHGGSETNLGTWGSWAGPEDNKFSSMKYEHGTSCWQGPNRSTQVKLLCGKETVVTSTSEPSRCEYLMEFYTPAACHPPPEVLEIDEHDEL